MIEILKVKFKTSQQIFF